MLCRGMQNEAWGRGGSDSTRAAGEPTFPSVKYSAAESNLVVV